MAAAKGPDTAPPTRRLIRNVAKRVARRIDEAVVQLRRTLGLAGQPSVLFEVYNPFGFDAQEPVIYQLIQRGNVKVHVSGGAERGLAVHRLADLERAGAKLHPLRDTRHRRFDAVIITDGRLVNNWRSSRFLFLHHGSGFGNRPVPYSFEILATGEANYLLALHASEAAKARQTFGSRMDGHVAIVGQPKLDRLVNTRYDSRDWLTSAGLDPGRRTVLFLSHWTPTSLAHTWGNEVLGVLRERRDLNVLVTGHQHLWDHPARSGGVDWRARLAWIADSPHMRLFPQPDDLLALMYAADLVVSDSTSGTMEYALLERPIVLFRHPEFAFSDVALDTLLAATTEVFTDFDGFSAAFERALQCDGIEPGPRRALNEFSFANVGTSTLRAAIAIETIARTGVVSLSETTAP